MYAIKNQRIDIYISQEMFEGCVLAVISIGLTIFNGVIIKCFDASRNLPTNMVLIRNVLICCVNVHLAIHPAMLNV